MVEYYGNNDSICDVLSLPLLFACFDLQLKSSVPNNLFKRIKDAYSLLNSTLPEDVNPVQRILLNVYRISENLHVDELLDNNTIPNDGNNTNNTGNSNNNQQNSNTLNALMVQNMQIKQQIATQHDETTTVINNF